MTPKEIKEMHRLLMLLHVLIADQETERFEEIEQECVDFAKGVIAKDYGIQPINERNMNIYNWYIFFSDLEERFCA